MPPTTSAVNTGATSSPYAVTDATSTSSIAASTFSVDNVAVDTDVTVVTSTVHSSPRKKAKLGNDAVAKNNSDEISKAPHNCDNTNTEGRIKDEQMDKKIISFLLEQDEIARKENENQDFCAICDDGGGELHAYYFWSMQHLNFLDLPT